MIRRLPRGGRIVLPDLEHIGPARIDPVEREHGPAGWEARGPVDVVMHVEGLIELFGALALAPGVHIAHQDGGAGIHLRVLEQRVDLAVAGAVDQREMRRDDAQTRTGMTDLCRQSPAAFESGIRDVDYGNRRDRVA